MHVSTITPKTYSLLLKDLRSILLGGKQKAIELTQQILVQTYWQVGQRICKEKILIKMPRLQQEILADISDELEVDLSTLKRCLYFYQSYKSATSSTFLTWSHYKILLSLKDETERSWYEEFASENQLSCLDLKSAINKDSFAKTHNSRRKTLKPKIERPIEPTYIYKGKIEKVIDGDTLLMQVDLGFQVLKEQRIRLAEIDCPALDEPQGLEAQKYVAQKLSTVDFVMVKTNKIDIYGRYVGYIFYDPTETSKVKIFTKGRFLNQELLAKGLARVF